VIDLLPADPVKRGRIKLLALAAFFALPVLAGYVAFFFDWVPGSAANYGTLIPARPLPDATLQGADQRPFKFSELRGKWLLVQFDSGACDGYCERKLYFMRQVRKALGKDMGRVERVWLLTDGEAPKPRLLEAIEGTRLARFASRAFTDEFPADRSNADHIYVVDPLGNLMMRFPRDPDPSRMLKDMQRLIKVSGIG
jgi:hypothetical protein